MWLGKGYRYGCGLGHLGEHVELERETHEVVRIVGVELTPLPQEVLLQQHREIDHILHYTVLHHVGALYHTFMLQVN